MYKIIGANQTEYGPISAEQVRQWIAEGRINAQTSAQAVGDTTWRPISTFPEFAASFPSARPPGPPPPPQFGTSAPSADGRARALSLVSGPAIGLIVTGALTICYGCYSIIAHMSGLNAHAFDNLASQNPQLAQALQTSTGPLGIVFAVLQLGLGVFVIFGGLKMKALEQHGLSLATAIISVIPCCLGPCCCISLPIGIWALVVLNKPEVRNYFS